MEILTYQKHFEAPRIFSRHSLQCFSFRLTASLRCPWTSAQQPVITASEETITESSLIVRRVVDWPVGMATERILFSHTIMQQCTGHHQF